MWELKGCPYCKETHFVNFARRRISEYVQRQLRDAAAQHHRIAQGDGFRRPGILRKAARRKVRHAIHPDDPVFPRNVGLKDIPPDKREVTAVAGYLRPGRLSRVFRFVRAKAYEGKTFREFLKSRPS